MRFFLFHIVLTLSLALSSAVAEPLHAFDPVSLVPRGSVPVKRMGINAFVNDQRFGTISSQFREVQSTLRLGYVRVLFAWNDQIQSSRNASPDFSFYDDIAKSIPRNVNALVILTGVPSWMSDSDNWIDGNPRKTFVDLWVKTVLNRYKRNKRIIGWQIWNEPNNPGDSQNDTLGITTSPENYLEMLAFAENAIRTTTPNKKVVNAATTSINQGYPETLDYNEAMIDGGIESLVDIFAIHYYSKSYERLPFVASVLNEVKKPIWVTESGAKGVNSQLSYVEEVWPILREFIPGIKRFYYYQFTEATPASTTYGLKNLTPGSTVSDLYIYLRDRRR